MSSFSTTDMCLAATLASHGYSLEKITVEVRLGTFFFGDVDDRFLWEYDIGKITVNPSVFYQSIKTFSAAVKRIAAQRGGV